MRPALLTLFLLTACAAEPHATTAMSRSTLFDFSDPAAARVWRNVDDVVMGGVSSSRFEQRDGHACFTGTVSLENNGGFASVRCTPEGLDLRGTDAMELDLQGDGHTYKLSVRLDGDFDGVSYQTNFTPRAGERSTVRIAFSELVPMWRGRRVPDASPFDPARAAQLGLVIGDKQSGPFELRLFSMRASRVESR
jgi:monofunctional biosynthetic peptidoglycan transglycosylase